MKQLPTSSSRGAPSGTPGGFYSCSGSLWQTSCLTLTRGHFYPPWSRSGNYKDCYMWFQINCLDVLITKIEQMRNMKWYRSRSCNTLHTVKIHRSNRHSGADARVRPALLHHGRHCHGVAGRDGPSWCSQGHQLGAGWKLGNWLCFWIKFCQPRGIKFIYCGWFWLQISDTISKFIFV